MRRIPREKFWPGCRIHRVVEALPPLPLGIKGTVIKGPMDEGPWGKIWYVEYDNGIKTWTRESSNERVPT